jgi:hypothetical protein
MDILWAPMNMLWVVHGYAMVVLQKCYRSLMEHIRVTTSTTSTTGTMALQ